MKYQKNIFKESTIKPTGGINHKGGIKVVFGIDMETDIGSWTPFNEGVIHGTPLFLDLCSEKDIKMTGFWVGDTARKFPEIVRDMKNSGHEIGTHSLYHETVGTPLFDIPGVYPLLEHEVMERCRITTDILSEIVGEKAVSWRCPRLFGSTAVTNALEELGYLCDATYPTYFHQKQLYPYHPSSKDWTQKGSLKLIEIPQFADLGMKSNDDFGRDRDQWPLYRTQSTELLIPHIESYIQYVIEQENEETKDLPIVLCFYFHPWEFWKMPSSPIHFGEGSVSPDPFITKGCGKYCLEQISLLIDYLKSIDAEFQTAGECANEWN